ncbi:MAG TPA: response regulator [Clostridia bacterium]|nr:response regulator [Clostridia bacterium]
MSEKTILVVEDETITAMDIEQSLRRKGYSVPGIACTGPEAIALAREFRPHLVLMDIRLKGEMDGITAARQIREEFNIPVVFLTAYADCATLQRAKSAEPFAYLLKPFEEAVLSTTIEIALHKHDAHQLVVRQSANALQLSDARFQHLANNIADYAVLLLDPTGQILTWSSGAEQIHGWDAGEVLGKHCSLLYPPDEVTERKPELDLEKATRAGRYVEYGCQTRKNDSRFSAQIILIALRNVGGNLAGFLKLTREVVPGEQGN